MKCSSGEYQLDQQFGAESQRDILNPIIYNRNHSYSRAYVFAREAGAPEPPASSMHLSLRISGASLEPANGMRSCLVLKRFGAQLHSRLLQSEKLSHVFCLAPKTRFCTICCPNTSGSCLQIELRSMSE